MIFIGTFDSYTFYTFISYSYYLHMYHYLSVDNISLKMFTGNFRLLLLNCKQLENVMFLLSISSWIPLLWCVYGDPLVAAVGADAQPFPTLLLPWIVAFQAPLPMAIFQARILELVAISPSRRSSRLKDQIQISYISYIGRWILYH